MLILTDSAARKRAEWHVRIERMAVSGFRERIERMAVSGFRERIERMAVSGFRERIERALQEFARPAIICPAQQGKFMTPRRQVPLWEPIPEEPYFSGSLRY
ncbi:MAG: hypothetical protein ACPGWR_12175 [Ardenticatenaceae bacterium]